MSERERQDPALDDGSIPADADLQPEGSDAEGDPSDGVDEGRDTGR